MIVDHTKPTAALLKKKKSRNPLPWIWKGWMYFSYFWCPPGDDVCIHCWTLRMFIVGIICGALGYRWLS